MSLVSSFVEPIRRAVGGGYRLVRAEEILPSSDVQSVTIFDEGNRGQALKGVMTEEYWLNPPYGRPRNIDYNTLQQFEKSAWVQICTDAKVDAVAGAEWDIVSRKKLERGETGNKSAMDEMRLFFENLPSEESFSVCLAEMLPDLDWYDAGVILKVFGVKDFDGETGRLGEDAVEVLDLSARDGRSFMIESSSIGGRWKKFWQYSWLNPGQSPTEFSTNEVMYFRMRPNSRGMYGTSKLEVIQDVVNYLMDSTDAQSKLFENGLFIGGQIDHPDIKDVNELRRKAMEYKKNLQGPKKAGKWLVTGGGVKVQGFPFNPQQMQWLDGQKWFAKLVLSIFKIAPSEIGWTEDLNRATGMQQMNIHKSRAIRPLLKLIEDVINRELVWRKYPDVSFKFKSSLDLEDKMKQAQIDEIYLRSGKVTVNELRERDGDTILDDEKFDAPFADQAGQEDQGEDEFGDWNPFGDTGDTTEPEEKPEEKDGFKKGGVGSGVKGHVTAKEKFIKKVQSMSIEDIEKTAQDLFQNGDDDVYWAVTAWQSGNDTNKLVDMIEGNKTTSIQKKMIVQLSILSQEYNKKLFGSDSIPLFRGGNKEEIGGRNMESWSTSEDSASQFGDVTKAEVPVNSIILDMDLLNPEGEYAEAEIIVSSSFMQKAVSVGAVSGEKGFAMTPVVVDGHVVTRKIEEGGEKDLKDYWDKVQKELEANLKEMYPDVTKGGVGSGIKGHITIKQEIYKRYQKMAEGLNDDEIFDTIQELKQDNEDIGKTIEGWYRGYTEETQKDLRSTFFDSESDHFSQTEKNIMMYIYALNQVYLKRNYGTNNIILYKGVRKVTSQDVANSKILNVDGKISSWSEDIKMAQKFAKKKNGGVIKAEISQSQVLFHHEMMDSPFPEEKELTILGKNISAEVIL